jgi:hypothetical protein
MEFMAFLPMDAQNWTFRCVHYVTPISNGFIELGRREARTGTDIFCACSNTLGRFIMGRRRRWVIVDDNWLIVNGEGWLIFNGGGRSSMFIDENRSKT